MELKNLAAAKIKATAALPPLLKDSVNPHFKQRYSSLSAVLEAIQKPFGTAGIAILEGVTIQDGSVIVECTLVHAASGESITHQLPMPIGGNTAQAVGSAITYGRRYLLMTMCGIAPEDDDGESATQPPRRQQAPAEPPQAAPAPAANGKTALRYASVSKAIQAGLELEIFNHQNHAQSAYDKLKEEHHPGSAGEMFELWYAFITARKLATVLEKDKAYLDNLYALSLPELEGLVSDLEQEMWATEHPEPETTK